MVRTRVLKASLAALMCVLLHTPAWAQQSASGLTGVVKDATGKDVAGVRVEAASPALIERVRTVFTDGSGQYKITDLPPGAYVVTFSAAGFNTLKRDGINLTAGFTGLVNADLKLGSPEQTITVSGEVSLVDSRNISQGVGITAQATEALPTGSKSPNMAGQLIPA